MNGRIDLGRWGIVAWNLWYSKEKTYSKYPALGMMGSWDAYALWAKHGML